MEKLYEIEDDTLVFDCNKPMEEPEEVEKDDKVVELFPKDVV